MTLKIYILIVNISYWDDERLSDINVKSYQLTLGLVKSLPYGPALIFQLSSNQTQHFKRPEGPSARLLFVDILVE